MSQSMTIGSQMSKRMVAIRNVLWIVLFLNLGVALAKFIYGTISNSTSMQADGIHSVFDSFGNIVGIIGISLAARPADEDHPYGHSKFETYASLAIGVMLVIAAFEVGSSAASKLISGNYATEVTPISFAVMIITLIVNVSVSTYERKRGNLLNAEILQADASHTMSDAFVSIGVIIGLVFVQFGYPVADPIMALIVTLAILYTAWDVFHRAFSTLSDHARIPEEDIYECVCKIPEVDGAHKIRTRGTEGEVYVDLHLVVDPNMTVSQAHALATKVENVLKKDFPTVCEVLVHIEPDDGSRKL